MLRSIVMTRRRHICDMFDEMPIMASRGSIKSLFKYLHLYHCFDVTFHFWKFHGVMGSGLNPGLEKSGTSYGFVGYELAEKHSNYLNALAVRVTGGSQSHACPCHGSD